MSEVKHTAPACKRIPQLTPKEIALFYSKINRIPTEKGCHLWTGGFNHSGYAVFYINRERFRASRIQWMLTHGEDPFPWLIRHTCDVEACVREEHVIRGSDQENMADAVERKTMASGECNGSNTRPDRRTIGIDQKNSKLNEERVIEARFRFKAGETGVAIANDLGVSQSLLNMVIKGQRWKHVGGPVFTKLPKGPRAGRAAT